MSQNNKYLHRIVKANEYIYWAISAWVGALEGRESAIKKEWRFNTRAKLVAGDVKMTAIIEVSNMYDIYSTYDELIYFLIGYFNILPT